ncbi:MAG: RIP metalloprotease RseP [Candidatus Omnitrophota bacterium]
MSILIFVGVLSILIIVHEFGHFMFARKMGVKVEQFSLGFGPRLFKWKVKDTEYTICAIPLGGFVKLAGDDPEEFKGKPDEYLSKSVGQRAGIIFCGPLLNYVLAFLCFWLIFFLGFPNLTCRVGGVIDNFGAKAAGIEAGDKILAIDGQAVELWEEMQKIIHENKQAPMVVVSVLRNEQQLEIPVKITQEEVATIWGEKKTIGLMGIKPADEFIAVRYGPIKSLFMGAGRLFNFTTLTIKSLTWMALGKMPFRQSVTGPLGIFYITKEAAGLGFVPLIQVVAIISMSLAIFNLLPLPVLDGGHILFLLIEKIRGKRLSARIEKLITQIGFSIILLLIISVFYNDLLKYGVFDKISQLWSK